jgi:hypothetical protein
VFIKVNCDIELPEVIELPMILELDKDDESQDKDKLYY